MALYVEIIGSSLLTKYMKFIRLFLAHNELLVKHLCGTIKNTFLWNYLVNDDTMEKLYDKYAHIRSIINI